MIKVLVVDDEQPILELTKYFLELDGQMQTGTATSAKQALSMMAKEDYDALVVDYQMPDMDGIELLKILRNQKNDVPFILFTGRGREDVAIEALNNGANYYLQKGTDQKSMFAELSNMILSSVSRRRAELELHESERRFRDMLDNVQHVAILLDQEGRLTYGNDYLFKITGFRKNEVIGSDWFKTFLKPEVRESERKVYLQLVQEGIAPFAAHHESEIVTREGEGRLITWDHTILKDVNSRIVGIASIGFDVTDHRRAEAAARDHQRNLFTLLDSIPAYASLWDKEARCIAVNRRFVELLGGKPMNEILGKTLHELFPKDLADKYYSDDARVLNAGESIYTEEETAKADKRIMVGTRKEPLMSEDGRIAGVVCLAFDLSEQKEAEYELRRLNRALKVLSQSNEAIARSRDELDLLRKVCRIMVNEGGYRFAWVGFAENDERKSVRPVAHSGIDDGYLDKMDITWSDSDRGNGPTGLAIRTGKPQVMRGIHAEPKYAPWREEATKRGYSSSISVPIRSGAKVMGALNVYSAQPDAFDSREVDLLAQLAGDLSHGIETVRTRIAEARVSGESMVKSQMLDQVADAVVGVDDDLRIIYWNLAAEQLYGWKAGEVLGKSGAEITRSELTDGMTPATAVKSLRETGGFRSELIQHRKDGSKITVEMNATAVRDAEGKTVGYVSVTRDLGPRREAEERLRKSEQLFRLLADSSQDLIFRFRLSPTRAFEYVSPSVVSMTGYTSEEYYADPTLGRKTVLPEDAHILDEMESSPINERATAIVRFRRKDGKVVWNEMRTSVEKDVSGNVVALSGISRDITDQKEAEQKLIESEGRYKTVFENTGAGMIVIENDMSVSMANAEFVKMSGYSAGEILGRKFTDFVEREEIPRLASYHRQRRKDDSLVPKGYEIKLLTKSRQERTLHARVSLIPGTTRSVASFVDITDRIRAEKAAKDAERFMDSVFSSIQDGISILDKDLRIVKVNATMERWYAHSMPLVGKKCHEAYHGKSVRCAVCPTQETLRTGKVAYEVVPKSGSHGEQLGWQEVFSYPQIDPVSGEMEGVIEYVRDISDRKHYEDALKQANEKLNLMGSITRHDALNQLGVLAGWLSIAMDSTQDKDLLEYLRKSNDASNLIRTQLEFTANYQEMGIRGPVWISVETAFNRGVAGLRFGEVAVTQDLSEVMIFADPMIDKVFHNLADNSLRHGGKVSKIDVWCERSGEELKICYSDDGQGIPKEEKTKIFSHGYGKHTGYGLYMARAILGITGMTIEEAGEPGQGAKFVITVPPQKFRTGKTA